MGEGGGISFFHRKEYSGGTFICIGQGFFFKKEKATQEVFGPYRLRKERTMLHLGGAAYLYQNG